MCSVPGRRYSAGVILAAGLLVLLGLGLFVAGVASGTTALYWATVAVCAAAAVLLLIARRRLPGTPRETHRPGLPDHPATSHRADDDRSRAGRGPGPAPAGAPEGGPPVPPPAATEPGRTDAAPG